MNRFLAILASSVLLAACTGADPITPGGSSPSTSAPTSPEPASHAPVPSGTASASATTAARQPYPALNQDAKVASTTRPKSCDELLAKLKEQALLHVDAYGLDTMQRFGIGAGARAVAGDPVAEFNGSGDLSTAEVATDDAAGQGSTPSHSATNIQEEGVGEFTKAVTNGKIIATIVPHEVPRSGHATTKLHLINPATLEDISTLEVPGGTYQSDALVAFANDTTVMLASGTWNESGPRTLLSRVDISDPANPKVTSTLRLNGSTRSLRIIDEQVLLVTTAGPQGLAFTQPKDKSIRGERDAWEANKRVIAQSTIEQWFADGEVVDGDDKPVGDPISLANCEQTLLTNSTSFSFTTVASVDTTAERLAVNKGSAILGDVSGVYASKDRLITWMDPWRMNREDDAQLTSFDLSKLDAITVTATGAVKGAIPGSWGVDEENGIIRVSSTTQGTDHKPVSRVTVLQEQDHNLVPVGRLDGLGQDEEIKSIRWLTPELGVLVTFKRTDPVYTIDTTDPTKPTKAGELKIPGYSAYLHPVGKHRILGIGQQANPENGQTLGLKFSLFDIADLNNPKELDSREFPGATSSAEFDHQAFTWFKDRGYVVSLNTQAFDGSNGNKGQLDVSGVGVDRDKIDLLGQGVLKSDRAYDGAQTMVIGDQVYAVNIGAIGKYDAATIKEDRQRLLP